MDHQQFRKYGHELIDWLADYMDEVETFPVVSPVKPGEIKSRIPASPPASAEPMERIFVDFRDLILPGITHWQHPGWFAYFPANNSPPSVLAELLTAGLGAQCMIWQTSPAAAELEESVMEWLREMLGLPEEMTGCIQDTASTATLCALLTAREKTTGYQSNRIGLQHPLKVYTSEETHSSIEKGVKIAGFGSNAIASIATDEHFAMVPQELEKQIIEDKKKGLHPCCVVATIGTTSSTAIDPLEDIGRICRRHHVWLHVDAAFAGTAAILPEMRHLLNGIEYADSFVCNPHKWMLTNFDCSAYFVRDPGALIQTFEIHPEYLKTGRDAEVKNYRDWGIQLGRRFRALKLWFVIRSYGVEGLKTMVREHLRLAQLFSGWLQADARFEAMAPVSVSLVCFRLNDGRPELQLNELNARLLQSVNETGKVFLTHTALKGKTVLRMMIGQRTTSEKHVRLAWDIIAEKAQELLAGD
ncbi:MAG: amino acid decarboxylase [Deltaproteobacteria bacterium SG8_13]|nr:MAG: amino acid decarboxylase [Deltaproteobacteria bacterium SG8_13]